MIHGFLETAYWSPGVAREVIERSVASSIPFGLYAPAGEQVGFARVVSDRAVFAYLADVFVLDEHRGRGLGKFLVSCVLAHPELQGLRRWALATSDAHELYRQFGFEPPSAPETLMFIERPLVAPPEPAPAAVGRPPRGAPTPAAPPPTGAS